MRRLEGIAKYFVKHIGRGGKTNYSPRGLYIHRQARRGSITDKPKGDKRRNNNVQS